MNVYIGSCLSYHRSVTRANSERATRIELAFSAWESDQRTRHTLLLFDEAPGGESVLFA